jgi:hypothetical protein
MAKRVAQFPGVAATVRWRGPGGGDGRADGAVPGRGGDGDEGGGSRGGGSMILGTEMKAEEEERDGDGGEGGGAGLLGEGRADGNFGSLTASK